jgi:glutamine synthetase
MSNPALNYIKELENQSIKFVSFCFTDIDGKFHRITYRATHVDENLLNKGVGFDASSIKGWKEIHHSDCILKPDLSTAFLDPFTSESCSCLICDVIDPETNKSYLRDPRAIATKAESYLATALKIANKAFVGPEMEFFIFDNVRFEISPHQSFYHLDSDEGPYNSGKHEGGIVNLGHRPDFKGGYFPAQPIDKLFDIRSEICSSIEDVGIKSVLHHHEVAASQCEIGFKYDTLKYSADNVQKFKYVVKNVASSFGKSATFMPKPVSRDNGSGMHTHFSLWDSSRNLFYQDGQYADLSELCLYFIGGIIKHGKALNAFTNPTTNSYKRLVPGFEAPVNLAYSASNRSAAIRIPYVQSAVAKRIEIRFPDPACNPYLSFASLLMAGLDGIKNKIHPGSAIDKNLYDLNLSDSREISSLCGSLKEALESLDEDRAFLKEGSVFTDDFIDTYIEHKSMETKELDITPHPLEFKLYYSC